MKKISLIILLSIITASLFPGGQAETLYVDSRAEGSKENGKSWKNAFSDFQDALTTADAGDTIWVAGGTYTPSETDSELSFVMKDDVDVYGGFLGYETSLDERNWESNETVLSGEIGLANRLDDNSLTVVMAANSVIDGFTITGGYGLSGGPGGEMGEAPSGEMQSPPPADNGDGGSGHMSPDTLLSGGSTPGNGSGIQIWQVSPEIRNCIITGNSSGKAGGIYIVGNFSGGPERDADDAEKPEMVMPLFVNCEISDNTAVGRGGGIAIDLSGSGIFIDCVFSGNACTEGKGGAIYNDFGCSPYFANCLFIDNFAQSGGAMGNDGESNPAIYRTTFIENEASAAGAALYQGSGPFNDPRVIDCILTDNICLEDEADIYNWNDCNPLVINSIVGENTNGIDAGTIGYNAAAAENRSEAEITELISVLMSIPMNDKPEVLDLSNPEGKAAGAGHLYVSVDGIGTGISWADSADLQQAIDMANIYYEDTGFSVEIWLSKGTYIPGDSRSDSFILREGVELYGGFNGTETTLNSRDIEANQSVLSGDIGIVDDKNDNSYHVLIGADNAIIDGFTITGGYADGGTADDEAEVYDNKGGAILNYHGGYRVRPDITPVLGFDTIVRNTKFVDNYAEEGGAVFSYHGGNPIFENCLFLENDAIYGGATVDRGGTNSRYVNCEFNGNKAVFKAGAIFVDYGSMAAFEDCSFIENIAGTSGGAVYVIDRASQQIPNETDVNLVDPDWDLSTDIFSTILVVDSEFNNNKAGIDGGALYIYESSQAKVSGSGFSGNDAGRDGDNISLVNASTLYYGNDNSIKSDDGISLDERSSIIE
jgi:predicted outer membrane repeat protein